jgi:hypothetical protein
MVLPFFFFVYFILFWNNLLICTFVINSFWFFAFLTIKSNTFLVCIKNFFLYLKSLLFLFCKFCIDFIFKKYPQIKTHYYDFLIWFALVKKFELIQYKKEFLCLLYDWEEWFWHMVTTREFEWGLLWIYNDKEIDETFEWNIGWPYIISNTSDEIFLFTLARYLKRNHFNTYWFLICFFWLFVLFIFTISVSYLLVVYIPLWDVLTFWFLKDVDYLFCSTHEASKLAWLFKSIIYWLLFLVICLVFSIWWWCSRKLLFSQKFSLKNQNYIFLGMHFFFSLLIFFLSILLCALGFLAWTCEMEMPVGYYEENTQMVVDLYKSKVSRLHYYIAENCYAIGPHEWHTKYSPFRWMKQYPELIKLREAFYKKPKAFRLFRRESGGRGYQYRAIPRRFLLLHVLNDNWEFLPYKNRKRLLAFELSHGKTRQKGPIFDYLVKESGIKKLYGPKFRWHHRKEGYPLASELLWFKRLSSRQGRWTYYKVTCNPHSRFYWMSHKYRIYSKFFFKLKNESRMRYYWTWNGAVKPYPYT